MISSWSLRNFKSVYSEPDLRMAPLTLFAGANSSGKSTIIQSILLTAQTLQNPVISRPIVLNGHILRLGTFSDVVTNGNRNENVGIGFKLNVEQVPFDVLFQSSRSSFYRLSPAAIRNVRSVDCHFAFSATDSLEKMEIEQLQPKIDYCSVKVEFRKSSKQKNHKDEFATQEVAFRRSNKSIEKKMHDLRLYDFAVPTPYLEALAYDVTHPTKHDSARQYYNVRSSGNLVGVSLTHFLPGRLCLAFDATEEKIRQFQDFLTETQRFHRGEFGEDDAWLFNVKTRDIFLETANKVFYSEDMPEYGTHLFERYKDAISENFSSEIVNYLYTRLTERYRLPLIRALAERSEDIMEALKPERESVMTTTLIPVPEYDDGAINYIQHYFNQKVKYLGPLRDEPKPIYPLAGATDPRDVGYKGEYTAAVLEIHKDSQITYIPSIYFSDSSTEPQTITTTLFEAVQDWLNYMGVVSRVFTEDKGKFGHELKVATMGSNQPHDLTHVGVGVSQLLPILVLCLLAETGSTLIFEQPELHLHPRVQTRLADFFISMMMINNQCIVETHSEYMINRLRYQVAISEGTHLAENIKMYFVEKQSGHSTYRPIGINQFGVIEDWPKGFFDENEENASAMLKAAMEKRRKVARRNA